jgi:flagellar motor component MotA
LAAHPESGDIFTQAGLHLIADAFESEYVKTIMEAHIALYAKSGAEFLRQTIVLQGILMIQNGAKTAEVKKELYALLGGDFIRFGDEDEEELLDSEVEWDNGCCP